MPSPLTLNDFRAFTDKFNAPDHARVNLADLALSSRLTATTEQKGTWSKIKEFFGFNTPSSRAVSAFFQAVRNEIGVGQNLLKMPFFKLVNDEKSITLKEMRTVFDFLRKQGYIDNPGATTISAQKVNNNENAEKPGKPLDLRPQVFMTADNKINLVRQAPPIENLVLKGGGAKGIGYPPALLEMERNGLLGGLKHVVGTSAGALTAIFLASGLDAEGLKTLSERIGAKDLTGKLEHLDTLYPEVKLTGLSIQAGKVQVSIQAGKALEILDNQSASHVQNYLVENWNTENFQNKLMTLKGQYGEDAVQRLAQLRTQDFNTDRTNQMITFNDLKLLHQLEPSKFKELTLTGWDDDNKREVYFNAKNTPDMPIAVAGRISMSIPIVFKPVTFNTGPEGPRQFTDGGVGSNMPAEVLTEGLKGPDLEEVYARTALMTFDEQGTAHVMMHGTRAERDGIEPSWAKKNFSGNPDFVAAFNADKQKVHDSGPNTFVVFHGDIDTRDFTTSKEKQETATLIASHEMREQIDARRNQAYAREFNSIEDVAKVLTDQEWKALYEDGPPDPPVHPEIMNESQRKLYDKQLESYKNQLVLYKMAIEKAN
ncbi:hypothetical protein CCP4SC76_3690005 [Gammaproteobacteria bacterium]